MEFSTILIIFLVIIVLMMNHEAYKRDHPKLDHLSREGREEYEHLKSMVGILESPFHTPNEFLHEKHEYKNLPGQ